MHAKPGSRELNVIREGQNGYTVDFLKRFVGQGRLYVRPIQRDLDLRWLETLFEKCEKNGFEHDIVDYYRVLKGKEYHSGMQK